MANVIDNEARNRSNMMPVGIKIIDDKGDVAHTAKTDLGTNYISLESKWFGSSSNNNGGSTGGSTGGNTGGGTAGGTAPSQVPQLPSTVNLFSGSAVGNILLSGPSANYDNVQDGLLITLSNQTSLTPDTGLQSLVGIPDGVPNDPQPDQGRVDLSSIGLIGIKIPKEKLIVNSSFDISDQLSQYIGKTVQDQYQDSASGKWDVGGNCSIASFEGTTINVLPNTTLSMNLMMHVTDNTGTKAAMNRFPIPVIRVNTYKN